MSTPSEDRGWGAPHPPEHEDSAAPTFPPVDTPSPGPSGPVSGQPGPSGPVSGQPGPSGHPDTDPHPPPGPYGYGTPGPLGYSPPGPYAGPPAWQPPRQPSKTLSVLGIVFGAVAVLFLPILFGPAAIICAGIAKHRRQPLANAALAVSIAGTAVGLILGALVLTIR